MSKRKYIFEKMSEQDVKDLHNAYPTAVKIEIKPNYSIISKLLDCGIKLPGVRLLPESGSAPDYIAKATEALK